MPKVIEWVNPDEKEIVYRYPVNTIEWGSQLIVKEFEAAVFYRDGKVYDVFRAGRHTITTANLPLLTKVLARIAGYEKVPFTATVIFVSLKQFQGKFGGQAQTIELAPLMFHGSFWFRIEDPNLFVNEVVGGQAVYDTVKLQEFLRGYFNQNFIEGISKYSLRDVYNKLDETSFLAKNMLLPAFKRIGLELIDAKFEGIDTTPEWRDRIFFLQSGVSASEVLRMQTVQKAAEELSKSPGAGVATGVAIIPPLFQQSQTQVLIACPYCGASNQQGSKFCSNCGKPLQQQMIKCPNGHIVPSSAKFCPECGARIIQELKCPKCGASYIQGQKFCSNCGEKLE